MTRIIVGQYYPTNSIIHRLDPRVKLIGAFAHIAVLLMINNFIGYAIIAVYVAVIIAFSKVPPRLMFRGLRAILFMLMFAVGINLFLAPGDTVIFQLGFVRLTMEGIAQGALMAIRLVLLVIGTSMLTLATSPIKLTDGIEALLRPLKIVKVPAHDIAMMMTITLRFIPILADEMDKIMKAQKARGADFETGGLTKRAKSLLPILVPLFVSAFKRADELATAMEARCYRGDVDRTKMKEMKMTPTDWLTIGVILAVSVIAVLTRML
ncbi:MAG: energy-coupling factor transporter transmembrane protein EcfT [Firmicutes bacterium]|nr:energy-coupling factor transporter transmembrane protein EcfT [Bacillota bacterium]